MTSPPRDPSAVSSLDRYVSLAIGAVASALIVLAIAPHGIGWSVDAANYVATARNLAAGEGYVGIGHEPFMHWAPLWPTVLAGAAKIGVEPLVAAAWLNAAIYGCIVALGVRWLFDHLASRRLAVAGSLLVVCASPLFETSVFAWSEPSFVLASLVAMIALERYLRTRSRTLLVVAALAAAASWSTRYIGVATVASGVVVLVTALDERLVRRALDAILFGVLATAPCVPWFLRNRSLSGSSTGFHDAPTTSAMQTLRSVPRGIAEWVGIDGERLGFAIGALLVVGVIAGFVFVVARRPRASVDSPELDRHDAIERPSVSRAGLVVMSVWTALYLALLAFAAITAAEVYLPGRLMSPAFVPAMLVALAVLDGVASNFAAGRARNFARAGLIAICVAATIPNALSVARTIDHARVRGLPFTPVQWQDVRVIAWVAEHGLDGDVYSNEPFALYRIANIDAATSPRRPRTGFTLDERYSLNAFAKVVHGARPVYLVWFSRIDRDWLCTLDEVRARVELVPIVTFQDGAVYQVK